MTIGVIQEAQGLETSTRTAAVFSVRQQIGSDHLVLVAVGFWHVEVISDPRGLGHSLASWSAVMDSAE